MKLFKVTTVKDGAWSTPVMVRETRIGAFLRSQAAVPGQAFSVEFVAEEEGDVADSVAAAPAPTMPEQAPSAPVVAGV